MSGSIWDGTVQSYTSSPLVVPHGKNPPEIRFEKVREIDRSYSCQQQIVSFFMWRAFNHQERNCCELLEKVCETAIFVADFNHSEPLWATSSSLYRGPTVNSFAFEREYGSEWAGEAAPGSTVYILLHT